jgi:hypothetical protein
LGTPSASVLPRPGLQITRALGAGGRRPPPKGLAHLFVIDATFTALGCVERSPPGEEHPGNPFDAGSITLDGHHRQKERLQAGIEFESREVPGPRETRPEGPLVLAIVTEDAQEVCFAPVGRMTVNPDELVGKITKASRRASPAMPSRLSTL